MDEGGAAGTAVAVREMHRISAVSASEVWVTGRLGRSAGEQSGQCVLRYDGRFWHTVPVTGWATVRGALGRPNLAELGRTARPRRPGRRHRRARRAGLGGRS